MREPAQERGDDEDGERDQEDAAAPEQVGGASAEQQKAAVAEDVGADDPLQRARGHVQARADRRQRDTHHRHVERIEEERPAEDEQRAPGEPGELVGAEHGRLFEGR